MEGMRISSDYINDEPPASELSSLVHVVRVQVLA